MGESLPSCRMEARGNIDNKVSFLICTTRNQSAWPDPFESLTWFALPWPAPTRQAPPRPSLPRPVLPGKKIMVNNSVSDPDPLVRDTDPDPSIIKQK